MQYKLNLLKNTDHIHHTNHQSVRNHFNMFDAFHRIFFNYKWHMNALKFNSVYAFGKKLSHSDISHPCYYLVFFVWRSATSPRTASLGITGPNFYSIDAFSDTLVRVKKLVKTQRCSL